MPNNKYELTEETIKIDGHVLHRIKALKDFGMVRAGQLGGFIESEKNLSQEGTCWVFDEAKVFGEAEILQSAEIYREARVYGEALVCGHAWVFQCVNIFGRAQVFGSAKIYGGAQIYDLAKVTGEAEVFGVSQIFENARVIEKSQVCGNAQVCGDALVCGRARILENAIISKTSDYIEIGPLGSRKDHTTFYKIKNGIWVSCGCFNGPIKEFREKVRMTHWKNIHYKNYMDASDFAEMVLSRE